MLTDSEIEILCPSPPAAAPAVDPNSNTAAEKQPVVDPNPDIAVEEQPVVDPNSDIAADNLPIITRCGHTFHSHCLASSLKTKSACPQCRHPINKDKPLIRGVLQNELLNDLRKQTIALILGNTGSRAAQEVELTLAEIESTAQERYREATRFFKNLATDSYALKASIGVGRHHPEVRVRLRDLLEAGGFALQERGRGFATVWSISWESESESEGDAAICQSTQKRSLEAAVKEEVERLLLHISTETADAASIGVFTTTVDVAAPLTKHIALLLDSLREKGFEVCDLGTPPDGDGANEIAIAWNCANGGIAKEWRKQAEKEIKLKVDEILSQARETTRRTRQASTSSICEWLQNEGAQAVAVEYLQSLGFSIDTTEKPGFMKISWVDARDETARAWRLEDIEVMKNSVKEGLVHTSRQLDFKTSIIMPLYYGEALTQWLEQEGFEYTQQDGMISISWSNAEKEKGLAKKLRAKTTKARDKALTTTTNRLKGLLSDFAALPFATMYEFHTPYKFIAESLRLSLEKEGHTVFILDGSWRLWIDWSNAQEGPAKDLLIIAQKSQQDEIDRIFNNKAFTGTYDFDSRYIQNSQKGAAHQALKKLGFEVKETPEYLSIGWSKATTGLAFDVRMKEAQQALDATYSKIIEHFSSGYETYWTTHDFATLPPEATLPFIKKMEAEGFLHWSDGPHSDIISIKEATGENKAAQLRKGRKERLNAAVLARKDKLLDRCRTSASAGRGTIPIPCEKGNERLPYEKALKLLERDGFKILPLGPLTDEYTTILWKGATEGEAATLHTMAVEHNHRRDEELLKKRVIGQLREAAETLFLAEYTIDKVPEEHAEAVEKWLCGEHFEVTNTAGRMHISWKDANTGIAKDLAAIAESRKETLLKEIYDPLKVELRSTAERFAEPQEYHLQAWFQGPFSIRTQELVYELLLEALKHEGFRVEVLTSKQFNISWKVAWDGEEGNGLAAELVHIRKGSQEKAREEITAEVKKTINRAAMAGSFECSITLNNAPALAPIHREVLIHIETLGIKVHTPPKELPFCTYYTVDWKDSQKEEAIKLRELAQDSFSDMLASSKKIALSHIRKKSKNREHWMNFSRAMYSPTVFTALIEFLQHEGFLIESQDNWITISWCNALRNEASRQWNAVLEQRQKLCQESVAAIIKTIESARTQNERQTVDYYFASKQEDIKQMIINELRARGYDPYITEEYMTFALSPPAPPRLPNPKPPGLLDSLFKIFRG